MNDPRKFKAPFIPKERIWQEADRLRAEHPAGRSLPVQILDLAEFDLDLDLVPVDGLREELDIDALLMGDLSSILLDKRSFMSPRLEYRLRFSESSNANTPYGAKEGFKPKREQVEFHHAKGPAPKGSIVRPAKSVCWREKLHRTGGAHCRVAR